MQEQERENKKKEEEKIKKEAERIKNIKPVEEEKILIMRKSGFFNPLDREHKSNDFIVIL